MVKEMGGTTRSAVVVWRSHGDSVNESMLQKMMDEDDGPKDRREGGEEGRKKYITRMSRYVSPRVPAS